MVAIRYNYYIIEATYLLLIFEEFSKISFSIYQFLKQFLYNSELFQFITRLHNSQYKIILVHKFENLINNPFACMHCLYEESA